jgi:hypothetical protein
VTSVAGSAIGSGAGGGQGLFFGSDNFPTSAPTVTGNNNNNNNNQDDNIQPADEKVTFLPGIAGGGGGGFGDSVATGSGVATNPAILMSATPPKATALGTGSSVGFGGGYGSALFFTGGIAGENAGGFGSGSAYGEALGGTNDATGQGSGTGAGTGGGYANGGGGGFIGENGEDPYVYEVGTYIPAKPRSPLLP